MKIIIFLCLFALSASSSAFANMTIKSNPPYTDNLLSGKIAIVYYHNMSKLDPDSKPSFDVVVRNDKQSPESVEITFTEEDMLIGSTLTNLVGHQIYAVVLPDQQIVTQISLQP